MEFEFIVNFRGETDYRSPLTGATRYRVRWHPNPEISDPAPVGTIRGHGLTLEIVRAFNAWTKQKHDADIVYIREKYGDGALKGDGFACVNSVSRKDQPITRNLDWAIILSKALEKLADIGAAYHRNMLDDEARKFWGPNSEFQNHTHPKDVDLVTARGGGTLLTLADALFVYNTARGAHPTPSRVQTRIPAKVGEPQKLSTILLKLCAIADAYDANMLDDEARKFWGRNNEFQNDTHPKDIDLVTARGGATLLTLADALAVRAALEDVQGAPHIQTPAPARVTLH